LRIRSNRRGEIAYHPDLPRLIADGCARVGDKWEPYYGELLEARCWAINLAKNYAADEGITFVMLNDEHDSNKRSSLRIVRSKGPAVHAGPFLFG
jgi:hypothetical protein